MSQQYTITKEQNDKLLQDDRRLADILPTLDSLEACGEDCTSAREFVSQARQKIANIRKHFGPNMLVQ